MAPHARLHRRAQLAQLTRALLALGAVTAAAIVATSARASAPAPSVTLEWVGDIAFGTSFGLPAGGLTQALAPVRADLEDADVTIGNLEGVIASGGASKCGPSSSNCFAYEAPPAYAEELHEVGFDVLNQANNHALDFGPAAQQQTLANLAAAHIAVDGPPGVIATLTVRGIHIAVVGFAPYPWANSLTDIPAAQALVRRAASEASLVVVIIHAGAEGADKDHVPYGTEYDYGENRGNSRAFTHAVIDAGASIVLGSGPHVIRGIERYRGHMIAYSLGDFACWNNLALGGRLSESAILRVTLSPTGTVLAGRWIPLRLVGKGLPEPDPSGASTRLVEELSVDDFGNNRYRIHSNGVIDPSPIS